MCPTRTTQEFLSLNIRTLRDMRGLSQAELAKKVGLSRRTVARLEAGDIGDPGVDQVRRIAAQLGTTLDLIVGTRLSIVQIAVPDELCRRLRATEGPELVATFARNLGAHA